MNLCLIRHADAVPLGGDLTDDTLRPLSDKGWRQCELLSKALQAYDFKLGPLITSPLLRAKQTAEGILRHWPEPHPEVLECAALAPEGRRKKLLKFLHGVDGETATLIGHQPDMGDLVAWLIGNRHSQVHMAKAAAAFVECSVIPVKGVGSLCWLITPAWCGALAGQKPDLNHQME
jgi:phosphohistidine phosphatase